MTVDSDNYLESQIAEWRTYVRRCRELHHTDAEELEDHLRSRITELTEAGLQADEAFLIAVKRMGSLDELSWSCSQRIPSGCGSSSCCLGAGRHRRPFPSRAGCHGALCGRGGARDQGACLFGIDISDDDAGFYMRNASLFSCWRSPPISLGNVGSVCASLGCSRCCSLLARSPLRASAGR